MAKLLRDTWLLFLANLRSTLRNPIWIIVGLFQPICYLLLFAPLLKNLAGSPGFPRGSAYNIFTPGLLILITLFSAAFVGFNLIAWLRGGVLERLRVTPVNRLALLLGLVARDVLLLMVQCALLAGLAVLMGFRPDVGGLLVLLPMLIIIGLLMASCSYALALLTRDEGALASTLNLFILPLSLLSGIMLPLTLAPDVLQRIAKLNPFTYAVDAARALVAGHLNDVSVLRAFVIFAALALLGLLWATRSMRQAAM
jgi:ABC-2 type transport system permease protein